MLFRSCPVRRRPTRPQVGRPQRTCVLRHRRHTAPGCLPVAPAIRPSVALLSILMATGHAAYGVPREGPASVGRPPSEDVLSLLRFPFALRPNRRTDRQTHGSAALAGRTTGTTSTTAGGGCGKSSILRGARNAAEKQTGEVITRQTCRASRPPCSIDAMQLLPYNKLLRGARPSARPLGPSAGCEREGPSPTIERGGQAF